MTHKLLSHPDRTLKEHLDSCNLISKQLLDGKTITNEFYTKNVLEELRLALVYFHDFGKATDHFQARIIGAINESQNFDFKEVHNNYIGWFTENKLKKALSELKVNDQLRRHAGIGSYFFLSIYENNDAIIELIGLQIIKRHHGNLDNFSRSAFIIDEQLEKLYNQQIERLEFNLYQKVLEKKYKIDSSKWENILNSFRKHRKISQKLNSLDENDDYKYFFLQHFLFSLLLSADKGDVILSNKNTIKDNQLIANHSIDNYKNVKFFKEEKKPIDYARQQAYTDIQENILAHSDNDFFSITLPTGMGKTLSAYNAAIRLQNHLQTSNYRIIYCLPFTSIIDQNEEILSEILEINELDNSLLSKHHHLSSLKGNYREHTLTYSEAEYLTEGWEHELVVTTFVQLLNSIFTNRNRRIRKFHNITNSIIILDEVQNIPPKYYKLIQVTFTEMAKFFKTKFILVTATQPTIFREVVELTDPSRDKTKRYFSDLNRMEIQKTLLNKGCISLDDFNSILYEDIRINEDKSFLIICNTIKNSQDVFKFLSQRTDDALLYLSSSILPVYRKKVIDQIKNNTKKKTRQIIISTQVVEAGVDIDLDIVYRDFAPLDSINQSAGRCNRNGVNNKGIVKLFDTGKAKLIYDSVLLSITKNILSKYDDIIAESNLYELNSKYFDKVKSAVQEENPTSEKLLKYMLRLQLKNLDDDFELIKNEDRHYNVFIHCNCKTAKDIWIEYLECQKIENLYQRKRAVKILKPKLLQYVTKFPKYDFVPPEEQIDDTIIYLKEWHNHYSIEFGYRVSQDNSQTAFF